MSGRYIEIDTIKDIDLSAIRPKDLGNRYIDRFGNRYALKFDMKSRRLKVVQIVKGVNEIHAVRDRMARVGSDPLEAETPPPEESIPDDSLDTLDEEEIEEDPTAGINRVEISETVSRTFIKTRDRLKAVINHLKKSNYFEKDPDPRGKNFMVDYSRTIDNDCIKRMESAISLVAELSKFPRPLSYYLNKLDSQRKARVESINGEEAKMELIKDWELQNSFLGAMKNIKTAVAALQENIGSPKETVLSQLSQGEKQSLNDAKVSAEYALTEINKVRKKVEAWQKLTG